MDSSTPDHNQTIVDQFTRQAAAFARMPAHSDAQAMQLLLDAAGIGAADRVLDVACGPGLVACAAAARARHVTGVDLTPEMIHQAVRLQRERGLTNMAWHVADVVALPFDDAAFSVVLSRYAFHHLTEPARVLREMTRVCAPGGRVVVADVFARDAAQGAAYDQMEKLRDPSHARALPLDEFRALFEHAGLETLDPVFYRLDVDLEELLSATGTAPAAADEVRRLVAADVGHDTLGITAQRAAGRLHFSFPIVVMAGGRPA